MHKGGSRNKLRKNNTRRQRFTFFHACVIMLRCSNVGRTYVVYDVSEGMWDEREKREEEYEEEYG